MALWADSGQTAIGGYGDADGNDISVSGGTLSVTGGGTLIGGGKGADQQRDAADCRRICVSGGFIESKSGNFQRRGSRFGMHFRSQ